MDISVTWDSDLKLALVSYKESNVTDEASFEDWKTKLFAKLEEILQMTGKKFPLVVNIDNVYISSDFEVRYGKEIAPVVAEKYASAIARYGSQMPNKIMVSDQTVKRILENNPEALKKEYASNIFNTKKEAIDFILNISNS